MDISRLHRVLRLVTILQSGTVRTVDELVDELEISRRTLFRDLNMLKAAGIPYVHEPGVGYRIEDDFFLPPINLKVYEAMGLMALSKSAEASRDHPLSRYAVDAVRKLVAMMPAPIREVCVEMMERVTVSTAPTSYVDRDPEYYALLQEAIDKQHVVAMDYRSLFDGGEVLKLKLRPYHLHWSVRAWYVIGFDELHQQERTFKLSRICHIAMTQRTFTLQTPFSIDDYLGKAWQLIPEGQCYQVVLDFLPTVATNVSEIRWHPTQEVEWLDGGRCRLRFEVDGLREISWWIMSYGDQVIVREPTPLKKMVRDHYQQALSYYDADELDESAE